MFRQTSVYGHRNTVFFPHKEHKDRKGLVFFVAYKT